MPVTKAPPITHTLNHNIVLAPACFRHSERYLKCVPQIDNDEILIEDLWVKLESHR